MKGLIKDTIIFGLPMGNKQQKKIGREGEGSPHERGRRVIRRIFGERWRGQCGSVRQPCSDGELEQGKERENQKDGETDCSGKRPLTETKTTT